MWIKIVRHPTKNFVVRVMIPGPQQQTLHEREERAGKEKMGAIEAGWGRAGAGG